MLLLLLLLLLSFCQGRAAEGMAENLVLLLFMICAFAQGHAHPSLSALSCDLTRAISLAPMVRPDAAY